MEVGVYGICNLFATPFSYNQGEYTFKERRWNHCMIARLNSQFLRKYVNVFSFSVLLALSVLFSLNLHLNTVKADSSFVHGSFTNDYGSRNYKLYIPSGYKGQSVPLVVMLHGCGQNPDDFAAGTKMNAIAERETFLAVYPEQSADANTNKCWNWFVPEHQEKGKGEPSIIAGITKEISSEYNVDKKHVNIAGMSAGGAMTVIVGAAYPDIYAAIGVGAGLEYKAAHDLISAVGAMETGGPDPDQQGGLAYLASNGVGRIVPTILFHGDTDLVVNVVNGHQTISQWAQTNDYADDGSNNDSIDDIADSVILGQVSDGYSYKRSIYHDARGNEIMEKWIVETMGHDWSGGSPDGSHTDPKGPDASEEMIRFFMEHPKNKS
jgi:poly(hydroxyalkanoate) depolymerase family esterase